MKIFFTFLSLFSLLSSTLVAQTIVGTNPENKNVVLEEFTGINCVACPSGHQTAQQIHTANPDDVVVIAIHTGGYANPSPGQPDYRTEWGGAIAAQTGLERIRRKVAPNGHKKDFNRKH
jgi:thiol-disulfide isomerase/thioredoxin